MCALGRPRRCASSPRTACTCSRAAALSVYDPKGEYQLVCEQMEPQGAGALQLAFEQLKKRLAGRGPVRRGAQAAAAGAPAQDRHRHLARRRGDPRHRQGDLGGATRTRTWSSAPARVQGEGAAADIARGLQAVAARRRRRRRHRRPRRRVDRGPVGVQRGGGGARDRRVARSRSSRRSATRPTSRSPTSSPTCARRRRRRPPRWSWRPRTSSARASTGWPTGAAAAARRRIERLRDADAPARRAGPALAGLAGAAWRWRGRHVAELTHAARRGRAARWSRRRERRYQSCGSRSRRYDLRRQIGGVRTRLTRADAALRAAVGPERQHARRRALPRRRPRASRASARWPCSAAATPCAGTRTARASSATRRPCGQGDDVRVTLHRGELAVPRRKQERI